MFDFESGKKLTFRPLKADEIEIRIGRELGNKGVQLLLYKTQRTDANILDETVGASRWQSSFTNDNKNCTISINVCPSNDPSVYLNNPVWITKEGVGDISTNKKLENDVLTKGIASESQKRSGFQWGLGRELYDVGEITIWKKNPEQKIYANNLRVKVFDIDEDKVMHKLVIEDIKTHEEVFTRDYDEEREKEAQKEAQAEKKKEEKAEPKKAEPKKDEKEDEFAEIRNHLNYIINAGRTHAHTGKTIEQMLEEGRFEFFEKCAERKEDTTCIKITEHAKPVFEFIEKNNIPIEKFVKKQDKNTDIEK